MASQRARPGTLVSFGQALWALLRLRCPRCHQGKLFRGQFAMNDPCPVCGLIIQREEGYFLGAMYASYVLGAVFIGTGYFVGTWLLAGEHEGILLLALLLLYLPLVPLIFRYSRTLWIYFERWVCPGDVSATAYEKARARGLAGPAPSSDAADPHPSR
jgi:uncharacterized protein (DUF983 family)